MTTPNNLKHAVFETSRHGDQSALVQIVGAFGTLGLVVPAPGNAEPMAEAEKVEALRHALAALRHAEERLEEHLATVDPEGGEAGKPEERVPLDARYA